jgi:hypothetical protein
VLAHAPIDIMDEIKTQRLVLVDSEGKERIILAAQNSLGFPHISLIGNNGSLLTISEIAGNGMLMTFSSAWTKSTVTVGINSQGPIVAGMNSKSEIAFMIPSPPQGPNHG